MNAASVATVGVKVIVGCPIRHFATSAEISLHSPVTRPKRGSHTFIPSKPVLFRYFYALSSAMFDPELGDR